MLDFLETLNHFVWGIPALIGIVGVGVYLTIRTNFAQLRFFPRAIRDFCSRFSGKDKPGEDKSSFQALCTALAATVGTGNLAGVAGAIALGGPGAIFWMWVCAFFGMVTKFAEATLAVRYRKKTLTGEYIGGPMVMIEQGLGKHWRWLGVLYSFFALVASFGVGNAAQINAVIGGVNGVISAFGGTHSQGIDFLIAAVLAVLICVMLLGGAKRIGAVAERLIPFASLGYLLLCLVVLIGRFQAIPPAFAAIVTEVSVIPFASFPRVFPVQGSIKRTSKSAFGPMGSAPFMVVMGSFPQISVMRLIKSADFPKRVSIEEAPSDIIGVMS